MTRCCVTEIQHKVHITYRITSLDVCVRHKTKEWRTLIALHARDRTKLMRSYRSAVKSMLHRFNSFVCIHVYECVCVCFAIFCLYIHHIIYFRSWLHTIFYLSASTATFNIIKIRQQTKYVYQMLSLQKRKIQQQKYCK